jgi:hypothetical protein
MIEDNDFPRWKWFVDFSANWNGLFRAIPDWQRMIIR